MGSDFSEGVPFIHGTINKLGRPIKIGTLTMVYRSQHFQEQTEIYRSKKAELQDPESDDDEVPIFRGRNVTTFKNEPMQLQCHKCGNHVTTYLKQSIGSMQWI